MNRKNNTAAYSLMLVMITVLLFVVTWKLILPGYAANKEKIAQLDSEILQATGKKEQLDQARSDLSASDKAYSALTVSVSEDLDEANLIAELEAIALNNGLVIPTIAISDAETSIESDQPSADQTAGRTIVISISVAGIYDQLTGFVTSLEKSIKFMNIASLDFTDSEGDQMNLSLTLHAYSRQAAAETEGYETYE